MAEINLLDRYPKSERPIDERGALITEDHRAVARKFGVEYFDGDRLTGYGGYRYNPRFWRDTVRRFKEHYNLAEDATILDVGCAKGYMLHDFQELMPHATFAGLDVSPYALEHALESARPVLTLGSAKSLPYPDKSFDLVICINTVHNLPLAECIQALQEIERVSRGNSFVTMDAWRNDEEKRRLLKWNLTALTYMHVDEWKKLFSEIGYTGDYYWFIAE
jgi:SAM-dependent methyltransferase